MNPLDYINPVDPGWPLRFVLVLTFIAALGFSLGAAAFEGWQWRQRRKGGS